MIGFLNSIKTLLLKMWSPMALIMPFFGPIAVLWGLFVAVSDNVTLITTTIGGLSAYVQPFPISDTMAMANRFFPVTEGLGMIGVIITLRIATSIVRIIKSFIPTYG